MKKFTRSLLLVAALFSMTACAVPNASADSADSGYTGPAKGNDDTFAISYVKDDAVTVTGADSAAKGTKVTFTVAYDSNDYVIDSIKVNNDSPFSEGNNSFSFRMPEGAATVTISGHYADPNHGKFHIDNANADKGVVLFGANEYAAEGETVSFSVKFAYDSPYTFTDSVTVTGVTSNVAVDVAANAGVYSFVMPADEVSVDVGLEANKYKLTISNSEKSANFASSPFAIQGEDDSYSNLSAEYFDSFNAFYVKYGSSIRAKVRKSSDRLVIEGLHLLGAFDELTVIDEVTPVEDEDYYYAYFTMPAYDIDVSAYGAVNYKSVTVVNSDHFQATLQSKVDGDYVDIADTTQIVPGDIVYVAISNIGEPDPDFELDKVTLSDGYLSTDTAGSLYHFTMSNKDNVTITVTEKNLAQYKGYDFVGTHYGANLCNSGSGKTASLGTSYGVTIKGDGSIAAKGTTFNKSIASIEEKNDGSFGVITMDDSKQMAYSGKFIFGHYAFSTGYSGHFGKDWLVAVKAQDGDTYSNYKFYYQIDSAFSFIAVQAFRIADEEETLYASMIYDVNNNELYSKGVTFEFTTGSKVNESTATYNVLYNETIIAKVENGNQFTNLVPHPQALTVVNSTHFEAAIFDGDTELTDTSAINAGATVTVKLTAVDAGDGAVEGTDYKFDKLSFSEGDPTVTTVIADREFTFKMPKADVTMTVVEKDLALFKDYPFIGSFYGANLYGSAGQKKDVGMSDYYKLTATPDGSLTKGTSTNFTITAASSATGDGLATLSNGNDFAYSDKFIFGHYGFSNKNSSAFGQDYLVSVKKSDASDASSLYKYNWQMGNSKNFISVEAYRDGALYAVMFYDAVNHEFYGTQLEFEFLDDKNTVGESTNYNIKVNGVVVGTVTSGAYAKA